MAGTRSLGAIAAAVVALAVAGCAGSEDPIPNGEAAALVADLDALQLQVNDGLCVNADDTVQVLFQRAAELPGGDVKKSLNTLLRELDGLVAEQCDESLQDTSTTDSASTSSTTTESTTSETTTDSSDTTDTSTTTDNTDTTTDPTTTGGDTTDPGDGGLTPEGG